MHDIEGPDRSARVVERALVEPGKPSRDFELFLIVLHDLELALERLGQGLLIAALFFQLGNLAHRVPVFGIDLVEDEGVAGDGAPGSSSASASSLASRNAS